MMSAYEGEPQAPNPVSRYYSDILYAENQSINLSLSFERLIDSLPITTDLAAEVLYDEAFMQHLLSTEPRIAKERMVLLPFYHIGQLLEDSNMPPAEIKQWYDDAVTGVGWSTNEDHDNVCLEYAGGTFEHFACEISAICPQRFLQRYLSEDVYLPNFQSERYMYRPERATEIASSKLEVGVRHKIFLPDSTDAAWLTYCGAYDDTIYAMLGDLSSLDVDKDVPQ